MICSTASLAADDVSVRCRVRRSETASNPVFDEFVEMTCTMRDWKPHNQYNNTLSGSGSTYANTKDSFSSKLPISSSMMIAGCPNDPELLLSPIQRVVPTDTNLGETHVRSFNSDHSREKAKSDAGSSSQSSRSRSRQRGASCAATSRCRSDSINRRRRWSDIYIERRDPEQERKKEIVYQPYPIPISDILVVDTSRSYAPIYLTTTNMGYFEFTFSTQNSHDILLAFLTSSLPSERVTCQLSADRTFDDSTATFDVEALTARRLREKVKAETFGERVRRKMTFFASRFSEISTTVSTTFVECNACGCGSSLTESPAKHRITLKSTKYQYGDDCNRELPPRSLYYYSRRNDVVDNESKHNDTDTISCSFATTEMELETTSCM